MVGLEPGTLVGGKYRIERTIGEGGMGVVYAARNERIEKTVALKVLHRDPGRDEGERFRREAIAASRVKHPGIVEIYDSDVDGDRAWIAMELLEGESLRARLDREPPLRVDDVLSIVLQALDALAAVHAAGIVHRDLKPDNLFLERRLAGGHAVKLLDFGIAKIRDHGLLDETRSGMAMGTPRFLAPEQATNAKRIDARADVYSMGVILYHAISGTVPYDAASFGDLVRQMFTSGPVSLADVAPDAPPALIEIVDRCLSTDPKDRYADAGALAAALCTVMGDRAPVHLAKTLDAQPTPVTPRPADPAPPRSAPPAVDGASTGAETPTPRPRRGPRLGLWLAVGIFVIGIPLSGGVAGGVLCLRAPTRSAAPVDTEVSDGVVFRWSDGDWVVRVDAVMTNPTRAQAHVDATDVEARTEHDGELPRWADATEFPLRTTLAPGARVQGHLAWYVRGSREQEAPPRAVHLRYGRFERVLPLRRAPELDRAP